MLWNITLFMTNENVLYFPKEKNLNRDLNYEDRQFLCSTMLNCLPFFFCTKKLVTSNVLLNNEVYNVVERSLGILFNVVMVIY